MQDMKTSDPDGDPGFCQDPNESVPEKRLDSSDPEPVPATELFGQTEFDAHRRMFCMIFQLAL